MLIFDKSYALLIAIVFGLAGLPWSFWIFRNDKNIRLFEKLVFGYMAGITLVPLLFIFEFIVGIMFSPILVYINWLIVLMAGIAMCIKDKAVSMPKIKKIEKLNIDRQVLISIGVLACMFVIFAIGLSASSIPVMDLDPYYYIDGVKQIVYEGKNYLDDDTAWYPEPISHHTRNPIWKYLLASWFSVYDDGGEYNKYDLIGVASMLAPIIGALSTFLVYFLFSRLYTRNEGLLAAGILAFAPIMLNKFQAGDFQIEPYNIYAFMMLFSTAAYAIKREKRDISPLILFFLGFATVILGSNLGSLARFAFPAVIGAISLSNYLEPTNKGDQRVETLLRIVGIVALVNIIYAGYDIGIGRGIIGALSNMLKEIIIPALALGVPIALKEITPRIFEKANIENRVGLLVALGIVGLIALPLMVNIPLIGSVLDQYITFGAYTVPLHKTIAEQAPGSISYSNSLGLIGAPLSIVEQTSRSASGDIYITKEIPMSIEEERFDIRTTVFNLLNTLLYYINIIPTALINLVYGTFVSVMNGFVGYNSFLFVQKQNSLMTFFVFFGLAALLAELGYAMVKRNTYPLASLMMLPIALPIVIMGFGKAKLVMYLAIATMFLAVCAFAGISRFFSYAYKRYYSDEKREELRYLNGLNRKRIATFAVAVLVVFQFAGPYALALEMPLATNTSTLFNSIQGAYGFSAMPLFIHSFEPRIYDDPQGVKTQIEEYCEEVPYADQTCTKIKNWNETIKDPVSYFNRDMCARSLWLEADPTTQMPMSKRLTIGYRCSFISPYWLSTMEWINENIEYDAPGSRVISWWDYGHWINFFGETKTVLRNEHLSKEMIGQTAHAYLHGDVKELRDTMREFDSRYALIDIEILGSGRDKNSIQLGGKYSALNYLGCAWGNETSIKRWPGQSQCEMDHLWETVAMPADPNAQTPCTISEDEGLVGAVAFSSTRMEDGQTTYRPTYCMQTEILNGGKQYVSYRLDEKDENGRLKLHKAFWRVGQRDQTIVFTALYSKDRVWRGEDGTPVSGWEDRTTDFYDSNVYSAFFLDQLEGFELVYNTPQIRIYRMTDEYWNSDR